MSWQRKQGKVMTVCGKWLENVCVRDIKHRALLARPPLINVVHARAKK